jgi:hypothetical protein
MKILLLSRNQGLGTADGQQIIPFRMYERELRERHDIQIFNTPTNTATTRTEAIQSHIKSHGQPDAVLAMPHWAEPADELASWFEHTRTLIGTARLIMLDSYDPTSSPHLNILPLVDTYIKKQVLSNPADYLRDFRGGHIYADFVANHWGFDLGDWHFGSKPDPAHLHKLVAGWNLGITPRYQKMLQLSRLNPIPWRARPIDVHLRVGTLNRSDKPQEWYQFSRAKALESVQPLADRLRLSGSGRVGSRRYFAELYASKIVFSPFGWGEVCFRDYEAVAAGALLVKPDMSHLTTVPDIYIPHETYIPVKWDLSDIHDVMLRCLDRPDESARVAANARKVLQTFYSESGFTELFSRITRQ